MIIALQWRGEHGMRIYKNNGEREVLPTYEVLIC